ncbi:hypothetical protein D3C73_1099070 [compost metagenome]
MAAAVAVNQGEAAVAFHRQRGFDNRHHRRDPGTGGDRQLVGAAIDLWLVAKVTLRHHHLKFHALLDIALGEA